MNVAVTMFKDSVSPRLDIADSVWIYHIDTEKGIAAPKEKCRAAFEQPSQWIAFLQEKGIPLVVCGGCPQFFLRMLVFHGVEVVPGVMGDPDHIVNQLARGKLTPMPLTSVDGLIDRYCRHRRRSGRRGKYASTKNKK